MVFADTGLSKRSVYRTESVPETGDLRRSGRIGADQKDTYKNLLKADFKNGLTALKAMKPKKLLKDKFENQGPQAGESPWEKRQKEIRENIRK